MKLFPFYCLLTVLVGPLFANAQTTEDLDAKLQEVATTYKLKGISAAVRFTDGSTWSKALGKDGAGQDLSADMLFEMGSITKSFTASIILQLVDEGKLSLNDSLHTFFDTLVNIDSSITLRQLLNHTSGIFSYEDNLTLAASVVIYPNKVWDPKNILRKFIEPMYFASGSNWAYSNTNYLLLGLIIEQVEERSFHESVRKRLFETVGLEHSYIDPNESYSEARALSWLTSGKYQENISEAILSAAWSAGALVATTKDIALWAEQLYGGSLLGTELTQAMVENTAIGATEFNYGFGTSLSAHQGRTVYGHNGNTVLQHANMSYCPELGISLAFAINQEGADDVIEQVKKDLLDYLFSQPWGLGLQNDNHHLIQIYPNPGNEAIQIVGITEPVEVSLYNLNGSLLLQKKVEQGQFINVSSLESGSYIAQIKYPNSAPSRDVLILH